MAKCILHFYGTEEGKFVNKLAYATKDENFRKKVLKDIEIAGVADENVFRLAKANTDPSIRALAIKALGSSRFSAPEFLAFLHENLNSQYSEIREAVITSFGCIYEDNPKKEVVDKLLELLDTEKDRGVLYSLVNALGQIGDEKAVQPLKKLREKWNKDEITFVKNIDDAIREIAFKSMKRKEEKILKIGK